MYVCTSAFANVADGASTMLSSAVASRIVLPRVIGDLILFQCLQFLHILGLNSSNLVHRYGPFIRSTFSTVPCVEYSGCLTDSLCMALSPSEQNLAIDSPALHIGSEQFS